MHRGATGDDDAGVEPIRVVPNEAGVQARQEPEEREDRAGEERRVGVRMVEAEQERREGEGHVGVAEGRKPSPRHAPKLQHRGMKPTLVQYEAPGWGVGEVWLDDDGVVF